MCFNNYCEQNKGIKIIQSTENITLVYDMDEICPACGTYTATGNICRRCLKELETDYTR